MLKYLLKQGSLAAAYLGVGYGLAAINDVRAASLRSYYGNKEYDSRFRGYVDNTSALLRGVGILGAGAAMFKADPVSTIGSISKKYINRSIAKAELAGTKGYLSRAESRYSSVYRPTTPDSATGTILGRSIDQGIQDFFLKKSIDRSRNAIANTLPKRIKNNNPYSIGLLGRLGIAGGVAAGAASYALNNPVGTVAGVAATTIGGSLLAMGPVKAAGISKSLLIGGGAMAAGATMAGMRTPYAASESSNSDIQHDGSSTIDRLNYSTAGLTFALHRNRRAI